MSSIPELLAVAGVTSLVMLVGSLVVTPLVLTRIRADYFKHPKPHLIARLRQERLPRCFLLVAKNLLGGVLLLAGILMLVLPGQGLLTILIGMLLMDFPRKFELERKVIEQRKIRDAIDWMRRKAGRPPLEL